MAAATPSTGRWNIDVMVIKIGGQKRWLWRAVDDGAPPTRHCRQLARLAFLAPDLQRMILDGREPAALTLRLLLKSELPLA